MGRQVKDCSNQVFGRLTVLGRHGVGRRGEIEWRCQCACGNQLVVRGSALRSGHTQSCGCFQRESRVINSTHHGHTANGKHSPEYISWNDMIARCTNPKSPNWKDYGGRGITVCKRWMTFENFLADMGKKPFRFTIERVNNNGNYELGNCRWATQSDQNLNKRTSVGLRVFEQRDIIIARKRAGEKYKEIAKDMDIDRSTLWRCVTLRPPFDRLKREGGFA